jgi:hypothetical protein
MKQTSMCRLTPLLITGVITRQNFRVLVRQVHHLVGGELLPWRCEAVGEDGRVAPVAIALLGVLPTNVQSMSEWLHESLCGLVTAECCTAHLYPKELGAAPITFTCIHDK